MSDPNETARILTAETHEQLIKTRDEEIAKIQKLRLVMSELRNLRANELDLPDTSQVERVLKMLSIGEYLRLNDSDNDCLLDLGELKNITLSYIERKAVRKQLSASLSATLKPAVEFGRKIRRELPEAFPISGDITPTAVTSVEQQPFVNQLAALETKRRANMQKLAEVRNHKCAYLKAATELKLGPYLAHELELMYTQSKLNKIKANLLRGYFINELVTRTDQCYKALQEVEGYVNERIQQEEEE